MRSLHVLRAARAFVVLSLFLVVTSAQAHAGAEFECGACGRPVGADDDTCPWCGARFAPLPPPSPAPRRAGPSARSGPGLLTRLGRGYRDRTRSRLRLRVFQHFAPGAQNADLTRTEWSYRVEATPDLGRDVSLKTIVHARDDSSGLSRGMPRSLDDDALRRPVVHLEEIYLQWSLEWLNFRVGKQVFAWGKGDGYNPTDKLNPKDYSDLVESEKIGVVSLDSTAYVGAWAVQYVWVPTFTPSRLPPAGERFSVIPTTLPQGITIGERRQPSDALVNTQGAIRVSTTRGAWDLEALWFRGWNDLPSAELDPTTGVITPVFDGVDVLGGSAATTWGRFGFHGEVGQYLGDPDFEDSYLQYVAGGDYSWYGVVAPQDRLMLIAELIGEEVTRSARFGGVLGRQGVGRGLVRAVFGRLSYDYNDYTHVELRTMADLDGPLDWYSRLSASYDLVDGLRATLWYDSFGGPADSFFGRYKDDHRVVATLEYSF